MGGARRTLAAALAAAAVVVTGAMPAAAGAAMRWSNAETLSPGFPGSVAIDARGDVLAVWHRAASREVQSFYAWRPPRGDWTEPRRFDGASGNVAIAVSPLGRATAVWNDGNGRIVAAEARPGRAFDRPDVIASGVRAGNTFDVETDDAGNAIVAWSHDTRSGRQNAGSTIFVSTRRAGGAWTEPKDVSGDVSGGGPFVAMNPAGASAVAWITIENGLPHVAYRQPAGGFGPPERVPIPGPSYPLQLALDESGRAYVSGPKDVLGGGRVSYLLSIRSPLGGWSEPADLGSAGSTTALLVEPNGRANLLITRPGASGPEVALLTRSPDGSVRDVVVAEGRGPSTGAMNLRGDILAAWEHPLGGGATGSVEAAIRPAGAAFSPAVPISAPNAVRPAVALREDPKRPTLPFPPDVDVTVPGTPRVDSDGDLVVAVRCRRRCTAKPRGVLVPGGGRKLERGSGKARRLAARRRGSLKLDFGTRGARAVRRAIKAGRKPKVYVSVRARGKSSRPMTVSRRVRLR